MIYDDPMRNPFRDLVPLTKDYLILFHIVVANAALHIANASQGLAHTAPASLSISNSSAFRAEALKMSSSYRDALESKQVALRLLRQALDDPASMHVDIVLATVLLFIELEVMQSGKDTWKLHMEGARKLVDSISSSSDAAISSMSLIRIYCISKFFVYVMPPLKTM